MKRASVMFLAVFAVLVMSSVANAEVICFSQDFDDTTLFPAGYSFGTAKGDAATTVGLWGNGGGSGDKPLVATDRFHGTTGQSIKVTRPSVNAGCRFYGTTTNGDAPFTDGQYAASTWLNLGTGATALVYTESYEQATAATPVHAAPAVAVYATGTFAGKIKAWTWNGTAWGWGAYYDAVTVDTWFGLKLDVDLDNYTYDVLVDTGSGYVEKISNVALNPNITYSIDSIVFYSQGSKPSYMWVDDCKLVNPVPEPSTLALLGCGLIGLLAYAWRKRR